MCFGQNVYRTVQMARKKNNIYFDFQDLGYNARSMIPKVSTTIIILTQKCTQRLVPNTFEIGVSEHQNMMPLNPALMNIC